MRSKIEGSPSRLRTDSERLHRRCGAPIRPSPHGRSSVTRRLDRGSDREAAAAGMSIGSAVSSRRRESRPRSRRWRAWQFVDALGADRDLIADAHGARGDAEQVADDHAGAGHEPALRPSGAEGCPLRPVLLPGSPSHFVHADHRADAIFSRLRMRAASSSICAAQRCTLRWRTISRISASRSACSASGMVRALSSASAIARVS